MSDDGLHVALEAAVEVPDHGVRLFVVRVEHDVVPGHYPVVERQVVEKARRKVTGDANDGRLHSSPSPQEGGHENANEYRR